MRAALIALVAALLAGCAQPPPRTFAFEVHNDGSVLAEGVAEATADNRTVSRAFQVTASQTVLFGLEPPAERFTFRATLHPEHSASNATHAVALDLAACQGLTVYRFQVTATEASIAVGEGSTRCQR